MGQPQWQVQLQWHTLEQTTEQATGLPAVPEHSARMPVLWDAEGDLARLCRAVQDQLQPAVQATLPTATPLASSTLAEASTLSPSSTPKVSSTDTPATVLPLRQSALPVQPAHPLAALVQQFNQQAPAYQQFRAALSATLQRCATRSVDGLVMHLARQAGNPGRVWALLLHHLHAEQQLALADAALSLVERELANLPASLRQSLHAQLLAAAPGQRAAASTRQAA